MSETVYVRIGRFVVGALLLAPFRLHEMLALVKVSAPVQAQLFGLTQPIISWLDVTLIIILPLALLGQPKKEINRALVYTLTWWALSHAFANTSDTAGYDGDTTIESFRLTVYTLAFLSLRSRDKPIRTLQIFGIYLTFASVCLAPFGGIEVEGRSPLMGFEVTSSGYIAGSFIALILFDDSLSAKTKYAGLIFPMLGLGMSGSRFGALATATVVLWGATKLTMQDGKAKRISRGLVYLATIIIMMMAVLASPLGKRIVRGDEQTVDEISTSMRQVAPGLTETFDRYSSFIGRAAASLSAVELIRHRFPSGYGGDWNVQDALVDVGYPSHSHSTVLQLILRFGIFGFIFLGFYVRTIVKKQSSENMAVRFSLVVLSIGLLVDYWLFVVKAHALLLALALTDRRTSNA